MEDSVYQARWLFVPVFTLCFCVLAAGVYFN